MQLEAKYFDPDFDSLVGSLLDKHHVPGISVAVVEDGEVSTKGYGFARLPDVRAGADTLYFTGSTTKAMVAAAIGRLMDKKPDDSNPNKQLQTLQKNRWATKLQEILHDDFVVDDEFATVNITIEDALSHRTGLAGADKMYGDWMGQQPKSIVRALRFLGPLNKMFRAVWQYNNLMYSVMGDILETVTGLNWGSAMRSLIWQPLRMTSTFWHLDEVPHDRRQDLARGYFWVEPSTEDESVGKSATNSCGRFIPEPYISFAGIAPAGSVISTVTDYAKWIKALLAAATGTTTDQNTDIESNPAQEEAVIPSNLFADLTTPRIFQPLPPSLNRNSHLAPRSYSLGWFHVPSTAGLRHPIITHAGGLTGFGAQLFLLPNDKFGCVVLANTAISSNLVGELLCLELMARRLALTGEGRSQFVEGLSAMAEASKETESAAAEDKSQSTVDGPAGRSGLPDAILTTLFRAVTGTYHHSAYGAYRVSSFEEAPGPDRIVYGAQVQQQDLKEREARRSQAKCLLVSAVGHRTWNDRFCCTHAWTTLAAQGRGK